jgi:hypothetical protein
MAAVILAIYFHWLGMHEQWVCLPIPVCGPSPCCLCWIDCPGQGDLGCGYGMIGSSGYGGIGGGGIGYGSGLGDLLGVAIGGGIGYALARDDDPASPGR